MFGNWCYTFGSSHLDFHIDESDLGITKNVGGLLVHSINYYDMYRCCAVFDF